jgi:lysophospholipase L1-like esterase
MRGPRGDDDARARAGRARLWLVLGALLLLGAWRLLTPDVLERHLSPDGAFTGVTRARIGHLRNGLGWVGLALLLAGASAPWWHAAVAAWRARHATGLGRAGLLCAATVLALLLAEAACRVDERLRPRADAEWDFGRYASACIADLRARGQLDPHGFRDLRFDTPRTRGIARVLFVGDSFVYGLGIPEAADTLPAALERALAAGGARVEVLNAGKCGADTAFEVRLLEKLLPRTRPDLVLLGYLLNDAETEAARQTYHAQSRVLPGLSDYLLSVSALWRRAELRLLQALRELGLRPTYLQHLEALYAPGSESRAAQFRRLAALQAAVEGSGCRCAVVLFPMLDELHPYPLEGVHETLTRYFAERGVLCLDLLDICRGTDVRAWQVSARDHHLNAVGAARVARATATWLIEGPLSRSRR